MLRDGWGLWTGPVLWSTVQVKGNETHIPLLKHSEQQVCSNRVIKLTRSITDHSAVGTGGLLNRTVASLCTLLRE